VQRRRHPGRTIRNRLRRASSTRRSTNAESRRISHFERRRRRTAEFETDADGYLDAVPRVGASFEEPPVAEPVVDDEVFVRPASAPGAAASAADEPRDDDAIDLLGPPASDAGVVEPAGTAEAESEFDVASWIGGDADTETDLAAHGEWPPTSGAAPSAAEHGAVEWMASESEAPSERVTAEESTAEESTAAESAAEVFAAGDVGEPVAETSADEQGIEAERAAPAADQSAGEEPAADEPSAEEMRTEELRAEEMRTEELRAEELRAEEMRTEELRTEEMRAEELAAEAPVPIPRPELPVAPRVPTPPAVARDAEREHSSGSRQQRLFGGRIDEALVQEATDTVVGARRASASLLQRKLRVDYELACELLAELDARGVVTLDGDRAHGRLRQE
jgi:ribosomal protein S25